MQLIKRALKSVLPAAAVECLRDQKRKLFRARIAERTFHGVRLSLIIEDAQAAEWYEHDWPEMPEVDLLEESKLKPGARAFNIGAHQAVVAMVLGAAVGRSGSVVALEADRHCADVAARNVQRNGMDQVAVLHAVGDAVSGAVRFTGHRVAGPGDKSALWTPSYSIDDLAAKYGPPDVLFIDVEGYECRILEGARKTLAGRPDCFVEVHVGKGLEAFGGSVAGVMEFFPGDRFRLLEADPQEQVFRPLGTDPGLHARRFYLVATAL